MTCDRRKRLKDWSSIFAKGKAYLTKIRVPRKAGMCAKDRQGVVLVIGMLLITILSLVGIAANQNVVTDTAMASNYLSSVQSFYIAEAGLERGKLECSNRFVANDWAFFTGLLDGSSTTPLAGLTFGSPVTFHNGAYAAFISNDASDSGGASVDTNRTITISATGSRGSSVTRLRTTIRMDTLPKLPGAVNLVDDANVSISGNTYRVDGNDYKLTDPEGSATGTAADRLGIALCNTSQTVSTLLSNIQHADNIYGSPQALGTSNELNWTILNTFITKLKSSADYTNQLTFGTADNPKITYINDADVSINPSSGLNGAGILIVDGRNLTVSGDVHWTGVIVVMGGKFRFNGGGSGNNITGGLIVGGGADSGLEMDLNGNIKLLYSKEAIDKVNSAIMGSTGPYTVLSWQRVN